jgi:O-antigen ligase
MFFLNKNFFSIIGLFFLIEILSYLGWAYPFFGGIIFWILSAIVLAAVIYKLEYGLYFLLAELFIGSMGRLFSFEIGHFSLSIRMMIFAEIMLIWFFKIIVGLIRVKKLQINFFKSFFSSYFLILFLFIAWGAINSFINHNGFGNFFSDFNAWPYFLIIFPLYEVAFGRKEEVNNFFRNILIIFVAACVLISLKTIVLLFIFSHDLSFLKQVYGWARDTRVGEITRTPSGFYRIFLQSQIYVLAGFFIIAFFNKVKSVKNLFPFIFLVLSWLTILVSLSRSFWIGLTVGAAIFLCYGIVSGRNCATEEDGQSATTEQSRVWRLCRNGLILFFSFILSIALISAIISFPYPRPTGEFNPLIFSDRASTVENEAGVSSRWSLLPELWQEIKKAPILGRGFGATVTYKSSDPRVIAQNVNGEYTTYAFEWGWLDIWLKLGFFGLVAYLVLIGAIIYKALRPVFYRDAIIRVSTNGNAAATLAIGLISICVVSTFSPYFNHPLGIGYLILVALMVERGMNNE